MAKLPQILAQLSPELCTSRCNTFSAEIGQNVRLGHC